jgi:hypothetical protein
MREILSQGGDREPGPWPRRLAAGTALLLVAVVIVWHLSWLRHAPARPARGASAASPVPPATSGSGAPAPGGADEPSGVAGPTLPWDGSLRLPVSGEQPAWLWPATGRMKPIGGLPRDRSGYQFIRLAGGWAVQANPAAQLPCGSCAGLPMPVYFLGDRAQPWPAPSATAATEASAPGRGTES